MAEQKGFLGQLFSGPARAIATGRAAVTGVAGGLKAGGQALLGQTDKARETLREVDTELNKLRTEGLQIGTLGKYKPAGMEDDVSEGIKDILGVGLETGAFLPTGRVASAAAKGIAGRAAIEGGIGGVLGGSGIALQEGEDATGVAQSAAVGGLGGASLGALVGTIGSKIQNRLLRQTEVQRLLEEGSTDSKVAQYMLKGSNEVADDVRKAKNKVVPDTTAIKAIRTGVDSGDVALIKGASDTDKRKMLDMMDIRQKQKGDKRFIGRATDVVGDTFMNQAKKINKLTQDAGARVDDAAKALKGSFVDLSGPISNLAVRLESAGVEILDNGTLAFDASDFDDLKTTQRLINTVWKRAQKILLDGDAVQAHRLKRFIDNQVEYGARTEGLVGQAENIVKDFRRNTDALLDESFPEYKSANDDYSEAIRILNNLHEAMGRRFRIGQAFADAGAGTTMRRILSNTKSRSDLLRLLDDMQNLLVKNGEQVDDDIVTQVIFTDLLEDLLGSEAKTSFLGQIERGVAGTQESADILLDLARQNFIGAAGKTTKAVAKRAGKKNVHAQLDAIRELLSKKKVSNEITTNNQQLVIEDVKQESLLGTLRKFEPSLTPDEKQIELQAFKKMDEDADGIIKQYEELLKAEGKNPKVYNPDDFRPLVHNEELFGPYDGTKAHTVQEPVSELSKLAKKRAIEGVKEGDMIFYTAGGPGAGKGSAVEDVIAGLESESDWGFDTVLGNADNAIEDFEEINRRGGGVVVPYVFRDIEDAWVNGVIRRANTKGRTVPLSVFLNGTEKAYKSIKKIVEKYGFDGEVGDVLPLIIDNRKPGGPAVEITLEELNKIDIDNLNGKFFDKLKAITEELHDKGEISTKIRDGLLPE